MVFHKSQNITIQFQDYRLRPLEEKDLDRVLFWRNSERVRVNMYHDHLITPEEHHAWFQRLKTSEALSLVFECNGNPVGIVNFSGMDKRSGQREWGFYIGVENMPKGTGFMMGNMGLYYAFEVLNVSKLFGEVFEFNTRSIHFHTKLGFRSDGTLHKHVLKNGKDVKILFFGLDKEDWLKTNRISEGVVIS